MNQDLINLGKFIYEKRKELETKTSYIQDVIEFGNENARKIAVKTLNEAKEAIGI